MYGQNVEAILAIIGIFFVPMAVVIVVVWLRSNDRQKRYQLQADLYVKAIENGQTVPPDFFAESVKKSKKKRNPLNTGIICMAVGIGISLFFWITQGAVANMQVISDDISMEINPSLTSGLALGIIPFIIGVAYVIIHFVEKNKNAGEHAQ